MFVLDLPLQNFDMSFWIGTILIATLLLVAAIWQIITHKIHYCRLRTHLWMGMSFFLMGLWLVKGQIFDLFVFHLIGASLAYLILGLPLTLLLMACVTIVSGLALHHPPWLWGLQFLLAGALPALIAHALHRSAEKKLNNTLFLYIFIRGFFISALTTSLTLAINLWLLSSWWQLISLTGNEVLWISPILLGWAEGFVSGMSLALISVYRPEWLYRTPTFKGF